MSPIMAACALMEGTMFQPDNSKQSSVQGSRQITYGKEGEIRMVC